MLLASVNTGFLNCSLGLRNHTSVQLSLVASLPSNCAGEGAQGRGSGACVRLSGLCRATGRGANKVFARGYRTGPAEGYAKFSYTSRGTENLYNNAWSFLRASLELAPRMLVGCSEHNASYGRASDGSTWRLGSGLDVPLHQNWCFMNPRVK